MANITANDALKHWAAWSRQYGFCLNTCCSIEKRFVNDPERYQWADDMERRYAFKPNEMIALRVEKIIVSVLLKEEIRALVACEVYGYSYPLDKIAEALGVKLASLKTYRLVARNKFKGAWHG